MTEASDFRDKCVLDKLYVRGIPRLIMTSGINLCTGQVIYRSYLSSVICCFVMARRCFFIRAFRTSLSTSAFDHVMGLPRDCS